MLEPWEDGLALDLMSEGAEILTPCTCKTCRTAKWEKAAIVLNDPGQKYSVALPMVIVRPFSFHTWIRKPPAAWVKWMAQHSPKKRALQT